MWSSDDNGSRLLCQCVDKGVVIQLIDKACRSMVMIAWKGCCVQVFPILMLVVQQIEVLTVY